MKDGTPRKLKIVRDATTQGSVWFPSLLSQVLRGAASQWGTRVLLVVDGLEAVKTRGRPGRFARSGKS